MSSLSSLNLGGSDNDFSKFAALYGNTKTTASASAASTGSASAASTGSASAATTGSASAATTGSATQQEQDPILNTTSLNQIPLNINIPNTSVNQAQNTNQIPIENIPNFTPPEIVNAGEPAPVAGTAAATGATNSPWNFSNSEPLFPNITNQIRNSLIQPSGPPTSGPQATPPTVQSYSISQGSPLPPELLSTIKTTTRPTRRKLIRRIRQMKQSIKGMEQTLFSDDGPMNHVMDGGGGRGHMKDKRETKRFHAASMRPHRRDAKERPPPLNDFSERDIMGRGSRFSMENHNSSNENVRPLKPIKIKVDPCKIPNEDDASTVSVSAIFKKPQKELKKMTRRLKRLQVALEVIRQ